MTKLELNVASNAQEMIRRAADFIAETLVEPRAVGRICLSGGETPRALYRLLAVPPYRDRLPWSRLHWFFGDERFVPPEDPRSNAKMANEALFSRAPAPRDHVHAMATVDVTLQKAADLYQDELRRFYGGSRLEPAKPLFDIVLLGLGADGHTASLFPGRREIEETERWVCAVEAEAGEREARLTLTRPPLQSARATLFLVAGEEKRDALAKLRGGDAGIPAARLAPLGRYVAFVDARAAGAPTA